MPLPIAPLDITLTIVKILADARVRKHLESLGVIPGAKLVLISSIHGGVICEVLGARVALDRDVAAKIMVAAS